MQEANVKTIHLNHTTKSANYVRTELPVRIAHRLRDLQALPYIVVTQEGVAKVHEVRVSSSILTFTSNWCHLLALLVSLRKVCVLSMRSQLHFEYPDRIRHYPTITSIEENEQFCEFLKGLLNEQLSDNF